MQSNARWIRLGKKLHEFLDWLDEVFDHLENIGTCFFVTALGLCLLSLAVWLFHRWKT